MIVIDRFEGGYAVCEAGGETFDVPRGVLPEGAVEGSALRLVLEDNSADRARVAAKQDALFS